MNIWGKLLGFLFGLILLKIPGALLGLWVGHLFDRSMARKFYRGGGFGGLFKKQDYSQQAFFFYTTFSVMGHIAKADGRVSESEIRFASDLMDQLGLSDEARREAQEAFREGKLAGFPLHKTLQEFRHSCFGRHDVARMFLELQIQFAGCDGALDEVEQSLLLDIASELGFSTAELHHLLRFLEAELKFRRGAGGQRSAGGRQQTSSGNSNGARLKQAYALLDVSPAASDIEVKRAYRRQMAQHHPDKLVAKGLPVEMMNLAKQKTQDLQAAYELVKQSRAG